MNQEDPVLLVNTQNFVKTIEQSLQYVYHNCEGTEWKKVPTL